MSITEDRLYTLIKQIDIVVEELTITNTLLLYLFQAQLKYMDVSSKSQFNALESLMRDNTANKRYLK